MHLCTLVLMTCIGFSSFRSEFITGIFALTVFPDDSPVSSRIPTDPDLEKRLWGMYAARCVHAWMHGEKGHKDVVVSHFAPRFSSFFVTDRLWSRMRLCTLRVLRAPYSAPYCKDIFSKESVWLAVASEYCAPCWHFGQA